MNLQFAFEVNRQTRKNIIRTVDGLTEEEINKIPKGFKNNIAWNLGHILITQQMLFYTMSGNKTMVSEEWIEKFKKSSRPTETISLDEFKMIKDLYITSINKAEEDYNAGLFADYKPYQTSYGIYINNIEDVIQFIFSHDAFHWGVMASIRKVIS